MLLSNSEVIDWFTVHSTNEQNYGSANNEKDTLHAVLPSPKITQRLGLPTLLKCRGRKTEINKCNNV